MQHLGQQLIVIPQRRKRHGPTIGQFLGGGKEIRPRPGIQHRGSGECLRQPQGIRLIQDVLDRVFHQDDRDRPGGRVVMRQSQPVTQAIRPVRFRQFIQHLILPCGKGRAGIPGVVPGGHKPIEDGHLVFPQSGLQGRKVQTLIFQRRA